MISIATSLIPFFEHDDANRALMGSNMMRQAVPVVKTDAPIVGTGMEKNCCKRFWCDSYLLKRDGKVSLLILIELLLKEMMKQKSLDVDIYKLIKYQRTNQNTCNNQKAYC